MFANVDNKMRIAHGEIFCPVVVVVIPFDDVDEAVEIASDFADMCTVQPLAATSSLGR
jgi:acyl-CoA reductase-like NAD-dependent aldehyde dehydrogenase